MSSEWMKVMLEEIARKRAEEVAARTEAERRAVTAEAGAAAKGGEATDGAQASPSATPRFDLTLP